MFSRNHRDLRRTATWRLAFLPSAIFAVGTALTLLLAFSLVNSMVRGRTETWLRGESALLAALVEDAVDLPGGMDFIRTQASQALTEIDETTPESGPEEETTAFFFLTSPGRGESLWLGPEKKEPFLSALNKRKVSSEEPFVFAVTGWPYRFRAIRHTLPQGGSVTLGVWDLEAIALNRRLIRLFAWTWLGLFILGGSLSWLLARSILGDVEKIAVAAESIDSQQLDVRVPVPQGRNEIAFLATTFNRMLDRIEASVNQIRVMTDALAHDMRSPITAIRGHLELAATHPDALDRQEAVAVALDGVDKLLRVLDANLDIAEAQGGALALNFEDLDLTHLADEMISFYMPVAEEKGLNFFLAPSPVVTVRGDANLFRRVLANLLDNAVRHLPAGCRVEVKVEQTSGGVRLTVADDGPGFPDDLQERAFDRFARGQSSEGSGLGLALVRAVARAHGGDATLARSHLGGAMVCLDLPRGTAA